MVVNEGLEVPKTEETPPESRTAVAGQTASTLTAAAPPSPSWLRLAYSFEFLLAMLTIFTLWSEIGGQGHLDLMPWYIKLGCGLATAWCTIRFTAGLVEEKRAWNSRSARWLSGLIAMAIILGTITYYYHLHEAQDQPDTDDTQATSLTVANPSGAFYRIRDRTNR